MLTLYKGGKALCKLALPRLPGAGGPEAAKMTGTDRTPTWANLGWGNRGEYPPVRLSVALPVTNFGDLSSRRDRPNLLENQAVKRHASSAGTHCHVVQNQAGELGFEPRQADSETAVLPLHHSPMVVSL